MKSYTYVYYFTAFDEIQNSMFIYAPDEKKGAWGQTPKLVSLSFW